MTLVPILVDVPEVAGLVSAIGAFRWTPTSRRVADDVVVMPKGFTVELIDGKATVNVAATNAEWVWRVDEAIPGAPSNTRYLAVPDLAEVQYKDLIEVDPRTLVPTADPDPAWYAYVDTLAAQAASASTSAADAAGMIIPARDAAVASAATATTKAGEASTSATNAAASASAASGSKDAAATSAGAALASKNAAGTSETNASGFATAASSSASAAAGSATAANTSKVDAQTAKTAAEAARDAAGAFSQLNIQTGAVDANGKLILTRSDTTTVDAGTVVLPTSLSVLGTTTGPDNPGTPGAQGLPGVKGDPGGFVLGTQLFSSTDLNTITAPGLYRQVSGSSATYNYPTAGKGTLLVYTVTDPTLLVQEWTPVDTGIFSPKVFYRRRFVSPTWGPWSAFNSTRVDQTAGRAIYQWDDVNGRDQLIYGDTGVRFVDSWVNAALFDNTGTARTITARRYGNTVSMSGQMLSTAAVPTSSLLFTFPAGFRPERMLEVAALHTTASTPCRIVSGNGTNTMNFYPFGNAALTFGSAQILQFSFTYTTVDAWPTTLPGVASGSIPNL